MTTGILNDYSQTEWDSAAGHRPLKDLPKEQLLLLHRAFIWANLQKSCADKELARVAKLGKKEFEKNLIPASVMQSHYYAWYAFLYALIEGFEARKLVLRAPFSSDIARMKKTLYEFRNAVFHVPRSRYNDSRLMALFTSAGTGPDKIRRVHNGFARLLYEELMRRRMTPKTP
jgi:hypothetical protein